MRDDEGGGEGESEEEREDIDRTCSRATRPPSSCQASWKEREPIALSLSSPCLPSPLSPSCVLAVPVFFRDGGVTFSSDTRGSTQGVVLLSCSPSPPHRRAATPSAPHTSVRLCPSRPWHGWVPKKRRKKPLETSRLAQKTTTAATVATAAAAAAATVAPLLPPAHRCPAKTTLHLRTCANCESKPPRARSPRIACLDRGDAN